MKKPTSVTAHVMAKIMTTVSVDTQANGVHVMKSETWQHWQPHELTYCNEPSFMSIDCKLPSGEVV